MSPSSSGRATSASSAPGTTRRWGGSGPPPSTFPRTPDSRGAGPSPPPVVRNAFPLDSLILILLWGTLSAAWNVAGGYAGQVSLGHAAFFGIGGYSAALLGTRRELSPS